MLILTRHRGQEFSIGNDISVKVLSIKGRQVRIGISAPTELCILRSELLSNKLSNDDVAPRIEDYE